MELLRVTEVIRLAGLIDTAWLMDEARDRGSAVHMAAHYLDENDLEWSSVPDSVILRLRQYQRWKDEMRPEILSI